MTYIIIFLLRLAETASIEMHQKRKKLFPEKPENILGIIWPVGGAHFRAEAVALPTLRGSAHQHEEEESMR